MKSVAPAAGRMPPSGVSPQHQRCCEPCLCATSISRRSASLTAFASGNAAATSGSSNTRFVPSRYRSAYFPRTRPFNCEKSYSGRISSSGSVSTLFIRLSLPGCRFPGANDADDCPVIRMCHDQHSTPVGGADDKETLLIGGMIGVIEGVGQRVTEHGGPLLEGDAVL